MPSTKKKTGSLIDEMDGFAAALLDGVKGGNIADGEEGPSFQMKLDAFKEIAKWVAIKNRIDDPADKEGSGLDAIRGKLQAQGETDRREAVRAARSAGGRAKLAATNATRWGTNHPDGDGGSALDAIKGRLPRPDDGDAGDDSDDSEREVAPVAGPDRGVRAGSAGGA